MVEPDAVLAEVGFQPVGEVDREVAKPGRVVPFIGPLAGRPSALHIVDPDGQSTTIGPPVAYEVQGPMLVSVGSVGAERVIPRGRQHKLSSRGLVGCRYTISLPNSSS